MRVISLGKLVLGRFLQNLTLSRCLECLSMMSKPPLRVPGARFLCCHMRNVAVRPVPAGGACLWLSGWGSDLTPLPVLSVHRFSCVSSSFGGCITKNPHT